MNFTAQIRWAGICLLATQLFACTLAPQISSIEPQKAPLGSETQMLLSFDGDVSQSTVALQSSGALELESFQLHQPLHAVIPLDSDRVLLAFENELQIWRTYPEGEGYLTIGHSFDAAIRQVTYGDGRVLVTLQDGRVVLLRVVVEGIEEVATFDTAFAIKQVALTEEYAYLLDEANQLTMIDLSFGKVLSPQNLPLFGKPTAMACWFRYCYFASREGVEIMSLEPGMMPVALPTYTVAGAVSDIKVMAGRLYLAGEMGLTILGLENPKQPQWLGSNNKFGAVERLAISNNMALAQDRNGRIMVVDTFQVEQPSWISSLKPEYRVEQFAVQGSQALLADGWMLRRLEVADMAMPAMNTAGINLGGSRRVALRDSQLYVADWFSGLHIYDISKPTAPRHVGNVHTPGSAKGVLLYGDYAYVGDDDHGLQVIDLRTKKVVHQVPTTGLAYAMDRVGDIVYLADHRGGFHLIDISKPEKAYIVGSFDTPGKVWSIQAYQNYAFVTDDKTGVLIFDVSKPDTPKLVAQYSPGGFAEDIVIRGHYAYVAFFDDGFHILDISKPLQPKLVGQLPTFGNARGIFLEGDLAYIADWNAGIQVVDIADPAHPRWLSGLDTRGAAWGVMVQGSYAYVMDWWGGIQVVDVSDSHHLKKVVSYHLRDTVQDVQLAGNYAYLANGKAGLQVFDVKNSQGPIWVTGLDLEGSARQLVTADGRAYLAMGDAGVAIVDISDPFYARLILQSREVGSVVQVAVWQQTLFTLSDQGVLNVWEMDSKGQLSHLSASGGEYRAMSVAEGKLLLTLSGGGLQVLDIARLQMEQILSESAKVQQAILTGNTLYMLEKAAVSVWQYGAQSQLLSHYPLPEKMVDMALHGEQLFLNGEVEALYVLDVSNGERPVMRYRYPRTIPAGQIAVNGDAVFSAGNSVLATLNQLPKFEQSEVADPKQLQLTLSAKMPLGSYDLLLRDAKGHSHSYLQAISVEMPKGKRSTFTMEDLQKALKEQQQLPTTP